MPPTWSVLTHYGTNANVRTYNVIFDFGGGEEGESVNSGQESGRGGHSLDSPPSKENKGGVEVVGEIAKWRAKKNCGTRAVLQSSHNVRLRYVVNLFTLTLLGDIFALLLPHLDIEMNK